MKTDCILSKKIGTSRFAAIFQIIEKQYFENLATKNSKDKAETAREKLLIGNLFN
jgi:hypothetical protein